jgi:hypothetical protein
MRGFSGDKVTVKRNAHFHVAHAHGDVADFAPGKGRLEEVIGMRSDDQANIVEARHAQRHLQARRKFEITTISVSPAGRHGSIIFGESCLLDSAWHNAARLMPRFSQKWARHPKMSDRAA